MKESIYKTDSGFDLNDIIRAKFPNTDRESIRMYLEEYPAILRDPFVPSNLDKEQFLSYMEDMSALSFKLLHNMIYLTKDVQSLKPTVIVVLSGELVLERSAGLAFSIPYEVKSVGKGFYNRIPLLEHDRTELASKIWIDFEKSYGDSVIMEWVETVMVDGKSKRVVFPRKEYVDVLSDILRENVLESTSV